MLRALKARVRDVETQISAELLPELEDGDTKAARLDDGTLLGKVTRTQGRRAPRVTDEHALTQWVKTHYPSEIAESVRPAFRDKLLETVKRHGEAVDESTGEIVPGIELSVGNPYLSFRAQAGCDEAIAANLPELVGHVLLEPGEEAS